MAMTFLAESSPLHSLNDPLELQCYSGLSPESTTERASMLSHALTCAFTCSSSGSLPNKEILILMNVYTFFCLPRSNPCTGLPPWLLQLSIRDPMT